MTGMFIIGYSYGIHAEAPYIFLPADRLG